MTATKEMVAIAAAMASPARINILEALAGGAARSATDLAAIADIQANTASTHLQVLCKANLIKVVKQGRYRYFRIRDQSVSDLVELLGEQTLGKKESSEQIPEQQKMQKKAVKRPSPKRIPVSKMAFARTCYDHLAGWLGVQLTQSLLSKQHITFNENSFDLTLKGQAFLSEIGVSLESTKNTRRVFARACQDWSEGELHIGGALGAELFSFFVTQKWVSKNDDYREVTVLSKGERLFMTHFGINFQ